MKEIIKQTDKSDTEQEMLKSAIELSKKETESNLNQSIQFIIDILLAIRQLMSCHILKIMFY